MRVLFTSPLAGEVAATAAGEGVGETFPINAEKGYPLPLSRHTACVDLPREGGGESRTFKLNEYIPIKTSPKQLPHFRTPRRCRQHGLFENIIQMVHLHGFDRGFRGAGF